MDFWGTVRVLRRRWYIALPAVLLTGILALYVYATVPTRYESSGVLVLTSPAAGGRYTANTKPEDVVRVNPLLQFDGSLTTTAQILTQILGDPKTAEELAGKGSTSVYTANTGPVGGPLLFITTESDSAESAEGLVGKVLEKTVAELAAQQKALSAPEQTFITAQVLVKPTTASAKIGGKVRYVGAATVVLLLLTLASTFAADSIMVKAKRRKEGKDKDGKDPAPSEKDTTPAPLPPVRPQTNGNGAPPRPAPQGVPNAHQKTVIIAAPKPDPAWPTKDD